MIVILSLLASCAVPNADSTGAKLLSQRCVRCHNADKTRGGLDLSTRETALAGGATMDAIVPGDLEKSGVYQRAKDHSMPPPKDAPPLSDAEVSALAEWIKAGAPWATSSPSPQYSGVKGGIVTYSAPHPNPLPGVPGRGDVRRASCIAVDSKRPRLRRWRRYGNVAAPLP
jgi:cytochrome c553